MLNGIDREIERVFYSYIKVKSETGTVLENNAEQYLMDYFKRMVYFRIHPQYFGAYQVKNDPWNRTVSWALVKGEGKNTVVFLHHSDIVDTEDFKLLKPFAYSPDELKKELLKIKDTLSEEAKEDLESGQFIFGRGTADMRAGGSIQLALIRRYSEMKGLKGNILLIAVPDEENLSAGMRSAVYLLDELKDKYDLKYVLMINSEPHQRKEKDTGVFSQGSVGKLMPFVYVRGYLSHAATVFEGFNPVNLLCEIVRRTELNIELSDFVGNEASPPPTCLYLKDSKQHYDVSMPMSASGCFSILTLHKTPGEVLEKLKAICYQAFEKVRWEMNESYKSYMKRMGKAYQPLLWEPDVVTFEDLYQEALDKHGEKFRKHYENRARQIEGQLNSGKTSVLSSSFSLVEAVYDYVDNLSPRVVIGFTPPYYPHVSNIYFNHLDPKAAALSEELIDYSRRNFNQDYRTENFYSGISDLSYTSLQNAKEIAKTLAGNMPLYGRFYTIPADCIEKVSMPCINIGPWGKDFHKLTERVCREDMLYRTPELVHHAVSFMLECA